MQRGRAPPETDTTGRKNTLLEKNNNSFSQFPGRRSLRYVSPCLSVALHISGQHHCLTSYSYETPTVCQANDTSNTGKNTFSK